MKIKNKIKTKIINIYKIIYKELINLKNYLLYY